MEMESFQLLHLARCATPPGSIRAATAAIVCANRETAAVITTEGLHEVEEAGGRAVLEAVTRCPLTGEDAAAAPSAKRARK